MLVDSHCHLDFPDFDEDRDQLIAGAKAAGVGCMVTVCTKIEKFATISAIAERYDNVFCSVGTHPHNADQELHIDTEDLVRLTAHPKVVAIGEAGLDYFCDNAPREAQAIGLHRHIAAARITQLPLVIHSRDADADMEAILRDEWRNGPFPFVFHCFSSGRSLAETGIKLGGYVSFSGILTFKRSEELREIARTLPLDRLLVETDAPYLAPVPHRGRRNEPSYVVHTADVLAQTLDADSGTIWQCTTENFLRLFSKVPAEIGDRNGNDA